ncbi:hypothetical protein [Asaia bogorensis]|uniref:hypothetical protein n=1 Tax=Asaia bogorensis TaxID=91915 RepID=UPI000EFAA1EE|nr:hypothetical protein [Asaia bogorensis]
MTWRPSANILRPVREPAGQGCYPKSHPELVWPPSALNGGGDYSIDFDALLAPGEFISSFRVDAGAGAKQAWTSLFGTIATAWLQWTVPGLQTVTVCALTSLGASLQVDAKICIGARPSLFPASAPPAPGAPLSVVTDNTMDAWLKALPTEPDNDAGGWFNNAGIPTRIGDPA